MATSEQLEREAEATRAQIAATLDELRSRLRPGQMVDEAIDYARDSGGGEFVRNLGRQVVDNPLPIALVGAGLAWLMVAGSRAGADGAASNLGTGSVAQSGAIARERAADTAESLRDMGQSTRDQASATMADLADSARQQSHDWAQRAGEAGADLRQTASAAGDEASATMADLADSARRQSHEWAQRAGEAGADLQRTASAAGSAAREAASTAYDAAAERSRRGADAVARGARSMSAGMAASGQNLAAFLREQPLVLAGIGLAVGALLGTSLPSTEMEDHLMGDTSDATKRDAKAFASEQVDKGKAMAEQAWNAAKPEIEEQLHRGEQSSDTGSASEAAGRHEPSDEATLVPSDEQRQAEMATDGARRDDEPSLE